jgi:hypothetical protein
MNEDEGFHYRIYAISDDIPLKETHELKTWPAEFMAVARGEKTFDLRENDRNFQVGDYLLLREYDPTKREYTGRSLRVYVTYLLKGGMFGLPETHCIMSISIVPHVD